MSVVLVTGGAGFIGNHLVRRLTAIGRSVRVLDNFSSGRRENLADLTGRFELIEGDIRDPATCERAAAGAEVILHVAAVPSVPRSVEQPRESHEANVTGTFNVLMAARSAGARVVYSASSSAYGDTPTLPKRESMCPSPLSPYAVAKLAGEHYCSCFSTVYGLQTVALRYFNVFGPRQDPKSQYAAVIPAFVTHMLRGERPVIYGDGEQSRDFCYIDNVVDANLLAAGILSRPAESWSHAAGPAESTPVGSRTHTHTSDSTAANDPATGQSVNVACGERITLNEIVARINQLLGTDITPVYQPTRAGDVKHSLADIAEARRVIGYQPKVMFAEGLKRTIQWFREHPQ